MDENTMALNVPDVLASALDEELVTLMHNQMHLFPLQYAALQQILMLQVQLLGDPLVDARAEVDELVANDGQNLNSPQVHAPDSSTGMRYFVCIVWMQGKLQNGVGLTFVVLTGCETASCYVAPQDTAAPSPLSPPSAPPSAPPQPPPPPREVQALTPERERQLLSCFMLQDEVSPALCKLLAAEVRCVSFVGCPRTKITVSCVCTLCMHPVVWWYTPWYPHSCTAATKTCVQSLQSSKPASATVCNACKSGYAGGACVCGHGGMCAICYIVQYCILHTLHAPTLRKIYNKNKKYKTQAANGQVSRPALGPHAHVGTHIHVGAHTGQRQQRMQHIQRLLDASNGGIGSAHYAGMFALMSNVCVTMCE